MGAKGSLCLPLYTSTAQEVEREDFLQRYPHVTSARNDSITAKLAKDYARPVHVY